MQAKKFTTGDLVRYTLVIALLVFFLFPIYWMITTSFKAPPDILTRPPKWVFEPTLSNYVYAFEEANFALFIKNTLIVSLISTALVIVLACLASYSFARYNPGEGHLMFFILTTRMMPAIAVIIPFFVIFRAIGETAIGEALFLGLDRPGALVVSYTVFNLPFAIWLMHSFFQDIPRELEDSARLDGYSRLQALWRVVLPLAAPAIAVTAIWTKEYVLPLFDFMPQTSQTLPSLLWIAQGLSYPRLALICPSGRISGTFRAEGPPSAINSSIIR